MDKSVIMTSLLFLCFAIQHSFIISDLFKAWMISLFGDSFYHRYFRFLFTLINLTLAIILIHYWAQLPDSPFIAVTKWMKVFMRIIQCIGVWILYEAGKKFNLFHFIGLRQLHIKKVPQTFDEKLNRDGIYGKIRHPMYLAGILILWGEPHLLSSQNGFTLVLLSTLYFYFGSLLEERRMVRQFGEEYERYQKDVPRLFPFHLK